MLLISLLVILLCAYGESVSILLGMFRDIKVATEDSSEPRSLLSVRATAFDYHYSRKEIYLYSNNSIQRYSFTDHLRGPSPSVTVLSVPTSVSSLAVDWVNDDIYWICQQRSSVEAASVNGTNHRVIVGDNDVDNLPHYHNIVVDPYKRKLFWLGSKGVYTSNLKGDQPLSNWAGWKWQLEDIVLDINSQFVYVIGNHGDNNNKVIARSQYDGSQATEILTVAQPDSKIYGFGLAGHDLYWQSSYDGENLYKCELPAAGEKPNVTLVMELNQIVYDMKIYHRYSQNFPK